MVSVAFTNLTFTNAVGVTAVPGTNQLCVWEREGRVWSFLNNPAALTRTLVLNITNQCQGWDDSGLLGLAFHPGFVSNRFIFVWYSWVSPGTVQGNLNNRPPTFLPNRNRLSRFTLDSSGVAITNSELILMDQNADTVWHKGGGMFFHPTNGFLYITVGDDEQSSLNSQRNNRGLFSGILRIDVDKRGGAISHAIARQPVNGATANYFIPNSNPFSATTNALEEFFAIGLRSPHRMTFDPPSGRIFIGDVGNSSREEIDVVEPNDPAALNFQWDRIEGLNGDLTAPYIGVNKRPLYDYNHNGSIAAIIGGYVYRGSEFAAELGGRYIYSDNPQRKLYYLDETSNPPKGVFMCSFPPGSGPNPGSDYTSLSSFGLDQNNEILMCQMGSQGGKIYKLAHPNGTANKPIPPLLSLTGVFTNLATLGITNAFLPYAVNSPLWSDAARKQRWISVPTNKFVNFTATGEWNFPNGTVFIKHFDLSIDETNTNVLRRLETRFVVRDTNGTAYFFSYRWRTNNSDADLVTNSLSENIVIQTASGTRTQTWFYPGPQDCVQCHTPAAGYVLGIKTRQVNGSFQYPNTGVTDNQLRAWNHIGLVTPTVNESAIATYDKLVPVNDSSAALELRVRSYVDANCAQCHRPGGVVAMWDARFDTPLANQAIINGSVLNNLGIAGGRVLTPKDLLHSIMYQRMNSVTAGQRMPPLSKNVIDTNAVAALAQWINTGGLPAPWNSLDIGSVGFTGIGSLNSGTFTINGSGDDIWNAADAFQYVYQPLSGDGEITARIVSVQNSDPWAKVGVMIRESLAANSKHAFTLLSAGNGLAFQRRTGTGSTSDSTTGPSVGAPYWVRLNRTGSSLTSYTSSNGINWSILGSASIPMSNAVQIGLAVTSHNNTNFNNAVFDHVQLSGGISNAFPTVTLSSPTNGATFFPGTNLSLFALASDVDGSVSKVEFFRGTNKLGTVTNSPYSSLWSNLPAGNFSLTAIATDNLGANSTSAPVNISVPMLLTSPQRLTNGQFKMLFYGTSGNTYVIDGSTNLISWQALYTNFTTNSPWQVIDTTATNYVRRFYRTRQE
ncbi:MAG: hypothetical protein JWM68_3388 [Verrucomicrobiales bacterium]|nr:hypothetical protein [Verrucomicrobiales bacterium]